MSKPYRLPPHYGGVAAVDGRLPGIHPDHSSAAAEICAMGLSNEHRLTVSPCQADNRQRLVAPTVGETPCADRRPLDRKSILTLHARREIVFRTIARVSQVSQEFLIPFSSLTTT